MSGPVSGRTLLPLARVGLALALVAAAMLLWKNMPTKTETWAPIAVDARVGERAEGRDLAVTVHSVELVRALTLQRRGQSVQAPAAAAWLVFSLTYEPLHNDGRPVLQLVADGRNYQSNLGSFSGPAVAAGTSKHGVAAFELPNVPSEAVFKVANQTRERWGNPLDAPLDSQIALPVDVAALSLHDSVDLDALAAE